MRHNTFYRWIFKINVRNNHICDSLIVFQIILTRNFGFLPSFSYICIDSQSIIKHIESYWAFNSALHCFQMKRLFLFLCLLASIFSCSVSQNTSHVGTTTPFKGYRYFSVVATEKVSASEGSIYGGQYGTYGSSVSKSVNPADVISGYMMKKGYICVPVSSIPPQEKTLLISYGESGRKFKGIGYSIEVTIQFLDAETHSLVLVESAEGMGETEVDDIRKAILKCMKKVFNEK